MSTWLLALGIVLSIVIPIFGYRKTVPDLRAACAKSGAPTLLLIVDIAAAAISIASLAFRVPTLTVLAWGSLAALNVNARPIIQLTGGPDPVCKVLVGIHEILDRLSEPNIEGNAAGEVVGLADDLDRWAKPETEPLIGIAQMLVQSRVVTIDLDAAAVAYDSLQAALEECRKSTPAGARLLQPRN